MTDAPEIVCKNCGANLGFYRNMEVDGVGWSDVQFHVGADGSIEAETGVQVEEIQWDRHDARPVEWGCSNCGTERGDFLKLVEFKTRELSEEDRIRQEQKHPRQGQLTLEASEQ